MKTLALALALALVACGGRPTPKHTPGPGYGAQVVTDMQAYADRECQCAEKHEQACHAQNTKERDAYAKAIDRSRPFSGDENAAIDAAEKRFHDCARSGLFEKIILE
jgi:hypothetical protein